MYLINKNIYLHSILYIILHKCYIYSYKNKYENEKYSQIKNINYCKKINIYSLSCFSYSIVGFFMLKYKTKFDYFNSFYPYFLILQGIISYMSDSKYIDNVHWSHNIDKTFAPYNLFICILIAQYYKINKIKWLLIFIGILSLKLGKISFYNNKIYLYCFFHTLWHTIIPIISIYTIIKN